MSAKQNSRKKRKNRLQPQDNLLEPNYILKKVFRKDGPPLGVEFDSLPSQAFRLCRKGFKKSHRTCQENERVVKRVKVSNPMILENNCIDHGRAPVKKYGMGKGLMTVWRVTNPGGGDFPVESDKTFQKSTPKSNKTPIQDKKKKSRRQQPLMTRVENKLKEKGPPIRSRKAESQNVEKLKSQNKEKCDLSLRGGTCKKDLDRFSMLVDDEELELKELQAGPNPLTCCSHFSTNKLHSCSLCKDLLAKFPPNSVSMKQLLCVQPWDSSPELVKKLFKVFHFLCTYAVTINLCSFTLDEFAQAFLGKDSLLLGKVNVALLKLLLIDVETEHSGGLSHLSKNCKFLGLVHSVENQKYLLKIWEKSLNSMTWIEILRQVLVAAGFGSKHCTSRERAQNKELNVMAKFGLSPRTLKGELFSILSTQGNNGLKVSELAESSQIADLNLASTTIELEDKITSILASDITLFEKISSSSYRLRIITSAADNCESDGSDSDGFGSVDDESNGSSKYDTSADSECDSESQSPSKDRSKRRNNKKNTLTVYNEIDESHPGEAWLLGLMEGEYSELNVEEKLDCLVALMDLVSAGSSMRMEEPEPSTAVFVSNNNHISSGGKIKRSTAKQRNTPSKTLSRTKSNSQPCDSSTHLCKAGRTINVKEIQVENDYVHPMQSIFLGSDRRYNRYWIFLGPCNSYDPGHKRIYFESSEDGHWEVIDTEEALCTLLSALDRRGTREAHLLSSLEKREASLCRNMIQSDQSGPSNSVEDSSSAISDIDNNIYFTDTETNLNKSKVSPKQPWILAQEFDTWTWTSFYSNLNSVRNSRSSYLDTLGRCDICHDLYWRDEKHCKICHITFELDFDFKEKYAIHVSTCKESDDTDTNTYPKHKVLSSRLQSLKAAIYAIESAMPKDGMLGAWRKSSHNLWSKRLRRTSTLSEFLQVLADFVSAVSEDWLNECSVDFGSSSVSEEIIANFSTMPRTSSAVGLWLIKLDSLLESHLENLYSKPKGRTCS